MMRWNGSPDRLHAHYHGPIGHQAGGNFWRRNALQIKSAPGQGKAGSAICLLSGIQILPGLAGADVLGNLPKGRTLLSVTSIP